ncbi:hypothetical protein [Azospirillum sp.]|uniref:hypothetical protein n=1 Tax=Azospirillum sp. TaxID=34012 RepID=UPI002D33F326|nr:hypothetical protein [Azospirillum sp.]HYD67100.1 hypothetical protein [Azospirillum sp.]
MPSRTELAFFVVNTHGGWLVRADGYVYGPYPSFEIAVSSAVHEAQAAGLLGFASVVLTQATTGQPYIAEWTYGHNPYPTLT